MSKQASRTTYTIYNFTARMGGQLLTVVLQFVTRTVFIHTLGRAYLGIGGLFNNIVSMLSLAEFGVGSAIIFKLYEPIASNDHTRIRSLMEFYKNVYRFIGIIVGVLGLALIPFLPWIIDDYERLADLKINAVFLYCLYLIKSVSSYLFFAYKSSLIRAHQKEYILNLVNYVLVIIMTILQIISLYLVKSFILFIVFALAEVIAENMIGAILANRYYPYLKEKNIQKIEQSEFRGIVKDCSALFLYRMNGVVLKATDNIIIAKFLGIDAVALYSNYVIFYSTINTLFAKIYNSVSHSLGNLHTTHDNQREYRVFKSVNLITAILGGTAGVGLFVVADEFVSTWVGADWTLQQPFALLLGLEVYTLAIRQEFSKYRATMGLFQQAKYRPVASMIINIIVSALLVNKLGIAGVLIGTIAADWLTVAWYDPIITHKFGFNNSSLIPGYFRRLFMYTAEVAVIGAVDWLICRNFAAGYGWLSVVIHALICLVTVPSVLVLCSLRSEEGQYIWKLFLKQVKGIKKKLLH